VWERLIIAGKAQLRSVELLAMLELELHITDFCAMPLSNKTHFVTSMCNEKKIFSFVIPCRHPYVRAAVVNSLKIALKGEV
jgi:hypothetical protein